MRVPVSVAKGFTLIELMIVVAIVGILASIALPQYQIYTGKAQVTEGIHLATSLKSVIAEQLQAGIPLASINGGVGNTPADVNVNAGSYVESLAVAAGTIIATMKSVAVSPCVIGSVVRLAPEIPASIAEPIRWTCSSTASCRPNTCG